MSVSIVEIMGRSDQGMTHPFICRGDDGDVYFVKGRGAGMSSLICEWIAGQLALRLSLPVAPFEIVEIPEALLSVASRGDLADLGTGKAFGSRRQPVIELSPSHLASVPEEQQRDVLAFDWWIRNDDRTLSERGGNPNLFWDVDGERLVVIDHNQAFDPRFSPADFMATHAFRGQSATVFGDWVTQQAYAGRFLQAMADWEAICDTVPPEWRFVDAEQTVPTDFDTSEVHRLLMRCRDDGFWSQR